jgi:glycosyltransferase involved in cell wall biosynthesis
MNESMLSRPDGISVVVCTHNGKERLEATLQSIFQQKTTNELAWEILVIDNASTDGTKEFCVDLKNKYNFNQNFRVISELNPGLNNARKKGLSESSFNWVLFCDDDNHLFDNYVQTGFNIISTNNSIGALGGMGLPLFESEKPDWFDQYHYSFAVGAQANSNGKIPSQNPEVYGAGCFFYKPVLQKIFATGFQTIMSDRKGKSLSSGGDVEWCYLIHLMKYEIWFSDDLKFYHLMPAPRLTWDYYIKLKMGIANGAALILSYRFYFKKGSLHQSIYLFNYIQRWVIVCVTYYQLLIKLLFNTSQRKDKKIILAKHILNAKVKSYSNNLFASLQHYKRIKLLLNNLQ